MNEHHSFVQEIRSNPRDDTPRLIYADYLEESGDPRGELIRVQCQLAALPPGDAARVELNARERELLDDYAEEWLEPLRALGTEGISARCFQRGLIERIRIQTAAFLDHGEELCRIEPALHCVELRRPHELLRDLAATAFPPQITQLDLSANRLTAADLHALDPSVWSGQLTTLNLQFNRLGDAGVRELLAMSWPKLETLQLGANGIGPDGARALANWKQLKQLTALSLNVNSLGDRGAEFLARSRFASRLMHLDLASNNIGPRGATALGGSDSLSALKRLVLRANRIDGAGIQAISRSESLTLETFDARNNSNAR